MGKNARIKRERREARFRENARRQAIIDKVDNTNIEGLTEEEQTKVMKDLLDNEDTCSYMIAKAVSFKQNDVVEAIRYYKSTGELNLMFKKPTDEDIAEVEAKAKIKEENPVEPEPSTS